MRMIAWKCKLGKRQGLTPVSPVSLKHSVIFYRPCCTRHEPSLLLSEIHKLLFGLSKKRMKRECATTDVGQMKRAQPTG
jgi:hypothetical protein